MALGRRGGDQQRVVEIAEEAYGEIGGQVRFADTVSRRDTDPARAGEVARDSGLVRRPGTGQWARLPHWLSSGSPLLLDEHVDQEALRGGHVVERCAAPVADGGAGSVVSDGAFLRLVGRAGGDRVALGDHSGAIGFDLRDPVDLDGVDVRRGVAVVGDHHAIDARIRNVLDGDKRAIATALLTGRRDAISEPVNDAMFISGLGHVLSISGYHMAVVAGVVFFAVRALLALIPALTVSFAIKKWSAVAALLAAAFYLLLSGAEVATQRSFFLNHRCFNSVSVDLGRGVLRKSSTHSQKLAQEIEWYRDLPAERGELVAVGVG